MQNNNNNTNNQKQDYKAADDDDDHHQPSQEDAVLFRRFCFPIAFIISKFMPEFSPVVDCRPIM